MASAKVDRTSDEYILKQIYEYIKIFDIYTFDSNIDRIDEKKSKLNSNIAKINTILQTFSKDSIEKKKIFRNI
jgi:hypothetical protein